MTVTRLNWWWYTSKNTTTCCALLCQPTVTHMLCLPCHVMLCFHDRGKREEGRVSEEGFPEGGWGWGWGNPCPVVILSNPNPMYKCQMSKLSIKNVKTKSPTKSFQTKPTKCVPKPQMLKLSKQIKMYKNKMCKMSKNAPKINANVKWNKQTAKMQKGKRQTAKYKQIKSTKSCQTSPTSFSNTHISYKKIKSYHRIHYYNIQDIYGIIREYPSHPSQKQWK